MGITQTSSRPRFALEKLDEHLIARKLGMHHLHGNGAHQVHIECTVYLRHTAFADQTFDPISISQNESGHLQIAFDQNQT